MSRINWNGQGSRLFEAGVDRGVLFVNNNAGVPWNGLISVSENKSGGGAKAYYLDGERTLTRVAPSEFSATLKAFSSPQEFDAVDGTVEVYEGLYSTNQPRRSFGLSYRTLIGNDTNSFKYGYKIHILYNVFAEPSTQDFQTLTNSPEAAPLSWDLSATPVWVAANHKPSAHFVVDSTKVSPELLSNLETMIYGSTDTVSKLPTIGELLTIFAGFELFRLTLLPDGHFAVEGSAVTDLGGGIFRMEDPSITDLGDGKYKIEQE